MLTKNANSVHRLIPGHVWTAHSAQSITVANVLFVIGDRLPPYDVTYSALTRAAEKVHKTGIDVLIQNLKESHEAKYNI